MESLEISTLIAVFEEMFGRALFWTLAALAVLVLAAFVWTLVRERGLRASRFLVAEIVGLFGGVAAVVFVQTITRSGLRDIGGPIDLIALLGIWFAGFLGTVMVAYALRGVLGAVSGRGAG